jgi:hypothetical protein
VGTVKVLLVMLILTASSTTLACESLEGAWELDYAVYKDQQGKIVQEIKGADEKSLKILSERHFSFITQGKDGKFVVAGAGTYSLEGNKYTEAVTYSSLDRLMGKKYQFTCQIKNGIWFHTGSEDHLLIEERWKRAN